MEINPTKARETGQFGARLDEAFTGLGEPLSLADIELAIADIVLPERTPAQIASFNASVRRRIAEAQTAHPEASHQSQGFPRSERSA